MCDCFHLAFPNWHAASSGTGPGRRLRAPEPGTEDDSTCDDPSEFTERPRPQGSSPVEEYPETEKYTDSDKECDAEHDPHHKTGSGKKTRKSGLGSMFEKRSTPKMSKLKEVHSPESGVIVKTAKDGCAEGLVYGGGGKDGIFIKEVVPESPASKSLKLKEGDQVLSATVYFDNVSYEDAIQILEHAQAYKVKLCLKRKPDIAETEPAIDSDVIPEEDVYAPEMREQGKTKRRGDARISWPKFPSFGKGKKSRFTRSHSSSEADEQRKLELSPTTSDTESPIKSQDALKGKKKHKIKLSVMTKRGRVSSSEDTDAPTSAQMLSPEGLESPSRESLQVNVTEDLKVGETNQDGAEPQTAQHKVELISLDSTLKTEDLTVALAGQEGSSDVKSPDGKKKRSELKMKILGKDKAHKKAKSPKRLKTLGASIEQADQAENYQPAHADTSTTQMEMTLPKVELEISDAALIQKTPKKGEDKTKKGKDVKHKQETDGTFKLPKVGFGDITGEETIPKMKVNVGEHTVKIEQLTTEGTEAKDPYERLSESSKLPKREDIEIPGMEDMSKKTKGIKEPKAVFTGHYQKMQADTVQMSIDVDSVKEAVSKLPGFKLPKIDTSGVPIPEEITVIDANAQRISVKTPTKIKHEEHSGKSDTISSPDKFKTTLKLPTIAAADLASEELLMVTQADKDDYKRDKIIIPGKESAQVVTTLQTQEGGEAIQSEYKSAATFKSKRAKIVMPSFGVTKPDIRIPDVGIYLPKQHSSEQKGGHIKGERTIFIQEDDEIPKTDRAVSDIKIPEIDGIEYIDGTDSVDGSPAKGSIRRAGENLDGASPKVDYTFQDIGGEIYINDANKDLIIDGVALKSPEREGKGGKFKLPSLGISRPKVKGPKIDLSLSKKDGDVTLLEAKADADLPEIPEVELEKPELEIKPGRVEGELDGHGIKFKKPKFGIKIPKLKGPEFDLSKKEIEVTLPQNEVKLPEAPEIDVTLRAGDVSIPGQKLEIDKPELEVKPLRIEGELDGHGGKFKMPEFGVKMPKMKRSEFDLSLSKKDMDVTLPQVNVDVKLPDVEYKEPGIKMEGPEIAAGLAGTPHVSVEVSGMDKDVKFDGIDIKAPSMNVEGPSIDMRAEGKGGKFKMPHLGFSMPKVKGPQFSSSKKDIDVTLPEITVEAKGPQIDATLGKAEVLIPDVEVKKPEVKIQPLQTDVELEAQGGKFQMPKFGITMPKLKGPEIHMGLSKKDGEVTLPEATAEGKIPKVDVNLGKVDVSLPGGKMEVKKPELEIEPLEGEVDIDGQRSNFKMPRLGMSMPKVKGPEFHFGLSRKDGDATLPEAKVEVPECDIKGPSAQVEIKAPEMKVEAKGKDGSPSKFKMPTFKLPKFGVTSPNVSVDLPDMDKDVKISGADVDIPDKVHITAPSVDIEGPLIDVKTTGTEEDGKGSKFKMPHLSFSMPKMKGSKKDVDVKLPAVDLGKVDVTIPEAKIEVKEPEIEMQMQSGDKLDGQGEKFKMPKFGMSMPKVKGPEFHLGLSKKDVDVTLPEVKADINLPDVELKKPEVEIKAPEIEVETKDGEASSKFKMPNFSFSMPKVKGPDIDLSLTKKDTGIKADIELPEAPKMEASLGKAEILIPEAKIEVKKPEVAIKPLQTDVKIEEHKSKFQMPKFGVSLPKVKGPEFDLSFSKKDVDVNLPDIKAKVELPEDPKIAVDMKQPKCETEIDFSKKDLHVTLPEVKAEVNLPEIKSPEIDAQLGGMKGSPSKFKLPTFKFPKFGVSTPNVSAEVPNIDKDIKFDGADMDISVPQTDIDVPGVKMEVHLPEVQVKKPSGDVVIEQPSVDVDGKLKKQRFSLPKFSFSKSSVKAPEVDANLQDVNVSIPEGKVDLKGDVDVKLPECEAEIEGSKFKMPKFGITMPNIKGPEIDFSLPKKDVDVTMPEAEVQLPDVKIKQPSATVEIKAPGIDVQTSDVDGSPSKMKMPSFKFPKFGVGSSKVSVEVPDVDKDIKIEGGTVDITAPSIDTEGLSVDVKAKGGEVEGSKFKMPKFGISLPKVKGPEIDLSLPKKDVDVTLPEAKAEVHLPDVKIKQPSATVEIKAPGIDVQTSDVDGSPSKFKMPSFTLPKFGVSSQKVSVDVPDVDKDIKIEGGTVDITAPSVDTEGLSVDMKVKGGEVEGSKFKMPKFGISLPKVKGPEIDLSLPKKDVDVTLPEAEVHLPDVKIKQPSATVEVKAPGIDVQTSDVDGSPSKFKMPSFTLPKFGVSSPKVSVDVPDVDKDIKIEGGTVDITAPSIDTEGLSVDMKVKGGEVEGPGSKFKMPKFGISLPKVKGPEIDFSLPKKDVDVTLPEAEIQLPDVKIKQPSATVEIKSPEIKTQTGSVEGSPSKFKLPTFTLPKFGVGSPKVSVEVPDVDKDVKIEGGMVDITAPSIDTEGLSVKAEGDEVEGSGSKFKMPKFGISMPKIKGPENDLSLQKKDVDVSLPEAKVEITPPMFEVKEPEVEIKSPEIKVTTKDKEGSPSKFKMPTFKLPKFGVGMDKDVKIDGTDINIPEEVLEVHIEAPTSDTKGPLIEIKTTGLKGPDVDVTLPEVKGEVKLPEIGMKEPSAEVEVKAPEIKIVTKGKEGSPSKYKMPSFKLPKFGIGTPSATVEVTKKDVKIDGADIKMPQEGLSVDIAAPSIDIKGPSADIKTTGIETEGKGGKFKLPSFGFSGPEVKMPDIDLSVSKKDVDMTLPEVKGEVKLPEVELKEPSAEVEVKAPEIKIATKGTEGSPSKYKMPTFKLPRFGIGMPSASVEVTKKDVKIDGADIKMPEEGLSVDIAAPSIDVKGPSADIKTTGIEHEGKGSKFKLPSFGFSGPEVKLPDIDLSVSKKDVDVTLPEVKAEVKLPEVELKEPSAKMEIKAPGIDVQTSNVEGSPSKMKMPTFKLPKFGVDIPQLSVEVPDVDKNIEVDGADLKLPEAKVEVKLPAVEIKEPAISVSQEPTIEGDAKMKKSWTLPKFSFSKTSVKSPEAEVNLEIPKVDVSLPEVKADVQLPDVKPSSISVEGTPAADLDVKMKKPRFSLPKFSFSKQTSKESNIDVSLPEVDVSLSKGSVEVKQPEVEVKPPECDVELEGQESKFKMPKFGISLPTVKGPEIDLSLPKKDVDVTLPEAEVQLPDVKIKQPSATVEVKVPGIDVQTSDVDGSPSKMKMPSFKLPKFGVGSPKVSMDVPDVDKDIKIEGGKVDVTAPSIETEGLSVDVKAKGSEVEGSGSKFKMPKFGISLPKVKGPEIDLSLQKKDVDVTLPEAEVQLPDVKIKQPSATVEVKAPGIDVQTSDVEGSPSKMKMPSFKLPKFGVGSPKVSVDVPDVDKDIKIEGGTVDITAPSIDTEGLSIDVKAKGGEVEGSGSKFKMPKFGISLPKVKGPEIDVSLPKKDVDVTLPEAKAEVQLPDVKIKQPSATVEIKSPEIEGNIEGSPSKLKMPSFTLPKFGVGSPKVSVDVPDVDKDIKIEGGTVDITAPSIDTEGLSVDVKAKGGEVEGSRFKMPKFGITMPKVKGPEIDVSLSKGDVDIAQPEVKAEVELPGVAVEKPESAISAPDAPTVDVETKSKRANWSFPKFSFSRSGGKAPDVDVDLEAPKVDVTSPEVKAEVPAPSLAISTEDSPVTELDASKKTKFSLPRFSFAKSSVKESEITVEPPRVDISLPEGEVIVKQPEIKMKAPELEDEHDGQGSKFKLPNFSIALPKVKGSEEDSNQGKEVVSVTLPDVKAEVKLPEVEVKESAASETEIKTKDMGGSPLKFKMPTMKMPKFGAAADVTVEAPDSDKTAESEAKLKEDITLNIKAPSVDIKMDTEAITDSEKPKTETDIAGLGSPSKFKLPLFKMPMLGFSRSETSPADAESKEGMTVELKAESKSPKAAFTSFGEILKNIDVEFDVPKTPEHLESPKEVSETDEAKKKETKQESTKSPERTGWFKFPKFGLVSPSTPAKSPEKVEKSTVDEEISPTCSIQSSDAFADISSAMTSEHAGVSLSSPTKVMVKYSDPSHDDELGEMHGSVITSTTRTEMISVEPNLPEKITILSSGLSSSSEDTLRLNSGKIHVITSNIQATPESQHANLMTAMQIQSLGGLPQESESSAAASWTVGDSQSGRRSVFERRVVKETSSERSESKETIVITKQITRVFDSSEPISGETASSIQRLKDSVHSEKMRFFDGADE